MCLSCLFLLCSLLKGYHTPLSHNYTSPFLLFILLLFPSHAQFIQSLHSGPPPPLSAHQLNCAQKNLPARELLLLRSLGQVSDVGPDEENGNRYRIMTMSWNEFKQTKLLKNSFLLFIQVNSFSIELDEKLKEKSLVTPLDMEIVRIADRTRLSWPFHSSILFSFCVVSRLVGHQNSANQQLPGIGLYREHFLKVRAF